MGYLVITGDQDSDIKYVNIPVPMEAASVVFDLERKAKMAPEKAKLEEFVRQFSKDISSMQDIDLDSLDDLLDLVTTLNLSSSVEKVVVRLLEDARSELE